MTDGGRPLGAEQLWTRETVVDVDGLATWLGVSRRIAEAMDLPFFLAGKRQRFIIGQCIDVLAERARSAA